MIRTRSILFVLGASAVVLTPACSDDAPSGDGASTATSATDGVAAVETVRAFLLAFNERNGDGLIDRLSDDACANTFGEPCDELRTHAEDIFVDQPAIDIRSVAEPSVDGETATLVVTTRIQNALHSSDFALVEVDGGWRIDDFQIDGGAGVPIPDGMPVVDVVLSDYAFELDVAELSGGFFALQLRNEGTEEHELSIKRVDVEADLAVALDPTAEQPPANTNFIPVAGSAVVAPGAEAALVLAESLPPGHYFLFCELTDPDGASHLEHGMAAEFTVDG